MRSRQALKLVALPLVVAAVLAGDAAGQGRVVSCCADGMLLGAPPASELTWPIAPEAPRVRFLGSLSSEANLGKPQGGLARLRGLLAGTKSSFVPVERPYDVYADPAGRVYVTDGARRTVTVFDPSVRKARYLGGTGPGRLAKPMGLAGTGNGDVYVADQSGRRVVAFGPDGAFLRAYGGDALLLNPVDVAVDAEAGLVYVADSYQHQVLAFRQADGALVRRLGKNEDDLEAKKRALGKYPGTDVHGESTVATSAQLAAAAQNAREVMGHDPTYNPEPRDLGKNRGGKPGEFRYPSFLAVGSDGTLYVSDAMNFRVQTFDRDGKFLQQIGSLGQTPGSFARPKGVAVDSEGHVYVVDAAFNNVQVFDRTGQLLLPIGSMGRGPGQLWLPLGIAVDGKDRIYVADRYNDRVEIYQYLTEAASRALLTAAAKKP